MRNRLTEIMRTLEAQVAGEERSYRFGAAGEYEIRVASSVEDRQRAWGLVYRVYLEKEYAAPNTQQLWYGLHDALPATTTFLVEKRAEGCGLRAEGTTVDPAVPSAFGLQASACPPAAPVAALTLVFDSDLGLPADELYGPELGALRSRGRRLCEIVSLVSVEPDLRRGAEIMKHAFKLAYLSAHHLEGATDFLITVNPRHVVFYRRVLLMEERGPERAYAKVGGAPALLLGLDLVAAWDTYRERFGHLPGDRNLYRFFLERAEELRGWLRRHRRPLDEAALRRWFVAERPVLAEAPAFARRYIEDLYLKRELTSAVALPGPEAAAGEAP